MNYCKCTECKYSKEDSRGYYTICYCTFFRTKECHFEKKEK